MKKVSGWIIGLAWLLSFTLTQAGSSADSMFVQAGRLLEQGHNQWSEPLMLQARSIYERLSSHPAHAWLGHYYLGLSDYRLANYYRSKSRETDYERYVDDGIDHLKKSLDLKKNAADTHALLGSLYGLKITGMASSFIYGPKSAGCLEKAIELDSTNPRVYLFSGISNKYKPGMFGGGPEKAVRDFLKAITCFRKFRPELPIYPDWGREEAHAWLGMVYLEEGDCQAAEREFNAALAINPDYGWVRYDLMRNLEKKCP